MFDHKGSDGFWESLNETIKEIVAEIDLITTCGPEKEQTRQGKSRVDGHPTTSTNRQHGVPLVSTGVTEPHKAGVIRRPQEEDKYWSVSSSGWLHMTDRRRMILSHVGRINETSEGTQAVKGDCRNCARTGADRMVYRDDIRSQEDDIVGRACSRCRYRNLNLTRRRR